MRNVTRSFVSFHAMRHAEARHAVLRYGGRSGTASTASDEYAASVVARLRSRLPPRHRIRRYLPAA